MLFCISLSELLEGYESNKQVVIAQKSTDFPCLSWDVLGTDRIVLETITNSGETGIKLAYLPQLGIPVITTTRPTNIISFDAIFRPLKSAVFSGEISEGIKNKVSGFLAQKKFDQELIDGFLRGLDILSKSLKNKNFDQEVDVDTIFIDQEFFPDTNKYLERKRSEVKSIFKTISERDNITLVQENEESELFFKLPSFETLTATEASDLVSSYTVKEPYPEQYQNAYTTSYKELWSAIPESFMSQIEGLDSNNKLGIQENEKKFATALQEWLEYTVRMAYSVDEIKDKKNLMLDRNVIEYLEELCTLLYCVHWKHNKLIPIDFRLDNVMGDDDGEERDEDPSSEGNSRYAFRQESGGEISEGNLSLNGVLLLRDYLSRAYTKLGHEVYISAIIKLARWGTRKCTSIILDGYDKIFRLGTSSTSDYYGTIDDYEVKVFEDGSIYQTLFFFNNSSELKDKEYFKSLSYNQRYLTSPVGVSCFKTLTNKNDSKETKRVETYFSTIDFVIQVLKGKIREFKYDSKTKKILSKTGTSVDFDKITSNSLVEYFNSAGSYMFEYPIYQSEALQDVYTEMKIKSKTGTKLTHLFLLGNLISSDYIKMQLDKAQFTTETELSNLFKHFTIENKATSVNLKIMDILTRIYVKVSNKIIETKASDFNSIINITLDAMIENNYSGECSFLNKEYSNIEQVSIKAIIPGYTDVEVKEEVFKEKANLLQERVKEEDVPLIVKEENVTKMNSFSTESKVEDIQISKSEPSPEISQQTSLIKELGTSLEALLITDKHNTIVGAAVMSEKIININGINKSINIFTLVDKEVAEYKYLKSNKKMIKFSKLVKNIFESFYNAYINNPDRVNIYFDSTDTMKYYVSLYKTLLDSDRL